MGHESTSSYQLVLFWKIFVSLDDHFKSAMFSPDLNQMHSPGPGNVAQSCTLVHQIASKSVAVKYLDYLSLSNRFYFITCFTQVPNLINLHKITFDQK